MTNGEEAIGLFGTNFPNFSLEILQNIFMKALFKLIISRILHHTLNQSSDKWNDDKSIFVIFLCFLETCKGF